VGRQHTTSITLAEVEHGIARLPEGRRKGRSAVIAAEVFADFRDVISGFDAHAARWCDAGIVAGRERTGHPFATADAQTAATCVSREARLATRITGDFDGTGVSLTNPWDSTR
jgi:predicted nucleic acid-binding protein